MASYNPPTENIAIFNSSLFNDDGDILTQAEADTLYLSKTKTDTSTAPLTTFNGQLVANGVVDIGSPSNFVNNRWRMKFFDINSPFTNYTQLYMIAGNEFVIGPNAIGDKVSVYIKEPSGTQIQRLEISHATTKITNILDVGTIGGSAALFRTGIILNDLTSPNSNYFQFYPNGNSMTYQYNGTNQATFHNFTASNNANANRITFKVGYDAVEIIDTITLNARLIKSTSTNSAHSLFDNMITGGSLTIGGTTSTNTIQGQTTFSNLLIATNNINTNSINGILNTGTKSLYTGLTGTLNIGQATTTLINVKGPTTFDLNTTISDGSSFFTRLIKSSNSNGSHSLFDNMTATGVLNIGASNSTNIIRGDTTFHQNINAKEDIVCLDKNSPFTNTLTINHTTSTANYISTGVGLNSFHNFTTYNSAGLGRVSFQVGYDQVNIPEGLLLSTRQITSSNNTSATHQIFTNMVSPAVLTIGGPTSINAIRGDTTFNQNAICNNRLNWGSTVYSFPFASNQSLGYYLKATGTGTTLISGVTKSILTTSNIPIGVWRIDFSVQNTVGAAGAGTITQAQSYVSTTLDGNNTTAVPFTGSIVRAHTAEVYGNNDIQLITSSFTYQQTTAGVLYLNAFRVFSTGTYSFTGELAITRIA